MAKDPAVLFYTADFLVGVSGLTMEERGQYITLLCLQHQKGHLSDKDILINVGKISEDVLAKFEVDEEGKRYNARMENELIKYENYQQLKKEHAQKAATARWSNARALHEQCTSNAMRVDNDIDNDNVLESIKLVINYLNSKLNTKYKSSSEYIKKNIRARLGEGFTPEDFYTVIDKKFKEWTGTKYEKFLRPETLFGTKFQEYLNQIGGRDEEYEQNNRLRDSQDPGREPPKKLYGIHL